MKAIVQDRFGPPDVLRLADVSEPAIGPGDVLIQVHAAALNPYDWHMLRGDPYVARLFGGVGLTRPRARVAGIDAAGRITAVGPAVRDLKPGQDVFGFCPGAFAEYAAARAGRVVPLPEGLGFELAAAVPMAATTALRGIGQVGRVQAGQRVLVNGAAGGVGHYAVQFAVGLGAEVTGVCGPGHVDLVRSLGASHVIDYTAGDFTATPARYDVILDNVGNLPLGWLRGALTPAGTLVYNAGGSPGHLFGAVGSMAGVVLAGAVSRQRLRPLPPRQDRAELTAATRSVMDGTVRPVVSGTYPLAAVPEALRQVETGHTGGKLVISVRP
ncbi:MAG TPA: NAD(P)-dependent alcohol dehydrogenase [Streptosporangiaceae bacterium]|nr:NAD(P)-dependent alcohol dehydrogenase [Streptosporangiaceae bacterium]